MSTNLYKYPTPYNDKLLHIFSLLTRMSRPSSVCPFGDEARAGSFIAETQNAREVPFDSVFSEEIAIRFFVCYAAGTRNERFNVMSVRCIEAADRITYVPLFIIAILFIPIPVGNNPFIAAPIV
jgi:hypothetical protein